MRFSLQQLPTWGVEVPGQLEACPPAFCPFRVSLSLWLSHTGLCYEGSVIINVCVLGLC